MLKSLFHKILKILFYYYINFYFHPSENKKNSRASSLLKAHKNNSYFQPSESTI